MVADAMPMTVHAHTLYKFPYFAGCLRGTFREGQRREISFPEADPQVVEQILLFTIYNDCPWLHPNSEKMYNTGSDPQDITIGRSVIGLYIQAHEWMIFPLQNRIIDLMASHLTNFKEQRIDLQFIDMLTEADLGESKLCHLLIKVLGMTIKNHGWLEACRRNPTLNDRNWHGFQLQALVEGTSNLASYLDGWDICGHWHEHDNEAGECTMNYNPFSGPFAQAWEGKGNFSVDMKWNLAVEQ